MEKANEHEFYIKDIKKYKFGLNMITATSIIVIITVVIKAINLALLIFSGQDIGAFLQNTALMVLVMLPVIIENCKERKNMKRDLAIINDYLAKHNPSNDEVANNKGRGK